MLALGFTFETSIAVSLLILRGALERHPGLKLLIAHAGGTLPYLAGRLDSCVKNDISKDFGLPKPPSHYLRQCWYDSIAYHAPALAALEAFADPAKIMFGTDPVAMDRKLIDVIEEKRKAEGAVSIFERSVPVDLTFDQVKRLD